MSLTATLGSRATSNVIVKRAAQGSNESKSRGRASHFQNWMLKWWRARFLFEEKCLDGMTARKSIGAQDGQANQSLYPFFESNQNRVAVLDAL